MNTLLTGCGLLGLLVNGMVANAGLGWQSAYQEQEIRSEKTIAFWNFDSKTPLSDLSGNGHILELRGADTEIVEDGKFGGGLQVKIDREPGDHRQGAVAAVTEALSPKGAFSAEMWIQPDDSLHERAVAYLLDKKFLMGTSTHVRGNRDYSFSLRRINRQRNEYRLEAEFGFGDKSETVSSSRFELTPGEWQHVAMTYDGQGVARLYLNGKRIGEEQWMGAGAIHAGDYPLVIGDRYGSTGHRFPGKISQVRLTREAIVFQPVPAVVWNVSEARTRFFRMEQDAVLDVQLTNDTGVALSGVRVRLVGVPDAATIHIPVLKENETMRLKIPVNTSLREGTYSVQIVLENEGVGLKDGSIVDFEYTIYPRISPQRMPVVMWGGTKDLEDLHDIGFTHYLAIWQGMSSPQVEFLSENGIKEMRRVLDELPAWKLTGMAQISVGRNPPEQYTRVDLDGTPHPKAINGLFPESQQAAYDLGVYVAKHFGDLPGLGGALLNTEIRDHTRPSYHQVDREDWKSFSGQEIPEVVNGRSRGVDYHQISDFPARRVIPEDFPLLNYYRWFWKQGDGWNQLHTRTHEGLKTANRPDWWTWFDPAVRAPSVYGGGGDVDYLSQWTYTYPDPLKIALAGEELMAMAKGKPGQQIMNMTQVIWYRIQTAPIAKPGQEKEPATDWEKENPEARFITISPDHLSQALWLKLSQPVKGIMYHGWGSLVGTGKGQTGYVGTNPLTRQRLTQVIRDVVEPLGPTLMQVAEGERDVAFLQSYASQFFAGRGTYGWGNGWGADSWMLARYAGLEPKIVYEETISQDGLSGFKLLFVTHCDVLTEKTVQEILKFQRAGGIVIGDEFLTPAIQPDVLVSSYRRKGVPDQDKATLLRKAHELIKELDSFYHRPIVSNNPEVLLARRSFEGADYLFAINDHRTFGNYIGHYRLVMEQGVPSTAQIEISSDKKFVYDLLDRKQITTTQNQQGTAFQVDLAAGEGRLYLCLEREVGTLQVNGSGKAKRGHSYGLKISIKDRENQTIPAVIPLQITVKNAAGEEVEGTGYYGARDGEHELLIDLAVNDRPGLWSVEVVEALTGQKHNHEFRVD